MKNIPIRSIQQQVHKPTSFESFKIRSVKKVLDGKDMSQDTHRHDFYFILVLSKGEGIHEIDFVRHNVVDNLIFFLRPGQVHRLQLKARSHGYLLEFNKDFHFLSPNGNELLRKAATGNCCKLTNDGSLKLRAILQSMLNEYNDQEDGYQDVIRANLEIFLIQFQRYRKSTEVPFIIAKQYRQEKLQEFLGLLEVNISTKKQVSVYAEMVNLSPFQLNSITKGLLGKTVSELIEAQIILEAKRYLLATPNQVNQIADHLGYDDVSYFIRFFKKHTGHSPEAFRNNFQ